MYKYTLYCVPGRLFRPGMHYLKIGDWVTDSSYIILCHGIMSPLEYRQFMKKRFIPIYQSVSFAWIGLYPAHESKKFAGTQFAGYLYRINRIEWGGILNVN